MRNYLARLLGIKPPVPATDPPEARDPQLDRELDLLKKALDIVSTEINLHITILHQQTQNGYLALTAAVTLLAILNSSSLQQVITVLFGGSQSMTPQPGPAAPSLIFTISGLSIVVLGVLVNSYLLQRVTAIMFVIFALGAYRSVIEKKINEHVDRAIFIWDSSIIPTVRSFSLRDPVTLFSTDMLSGFFRMLVYIAANGILGYIGCLMSSDYCPWIIIGDVYISVLVLAEYLFCNLMSRARLNSEISEKFSRSLSESIKSPDSIEIPFLGERFTMRNDRAWTMSNRLWIVLLTLLAGTFPMAVLSLFGGTFWPSSPVNFPFVLLVSVSVGDTLIYPVLNALTYSISARVVYPKRRMLLSLSVLMLIASSGIQYAIHLAWISDNYTAFMDENPGSLSAAGIWHLGYSIVQMTILGWFLLVTVLSVRQRRVDNVRLLLGGWLWLGLAPIIAAVDFWMKWERVFPTYSLTKMIMFDYYWIMMFFGIGGVIVALSVARHKLQHHLVNPQIPGGQG